MNIPFNAEEVFEMAEEIERNGSKFYRASAKKFPQVGQVLLELAAMEDEHEKTFKAMRQELSGSEVDSPVFDPDNEAEMYLRVMADDHVFDLKANPLELLNKQKTLKDVLLVAIEIEKDSITFYVGLKECVSQRAGKDKIDDIIKQEYSHIQTLSAKLHEL